MIPSKFWVVYISVSCTLWIVSYWYTSCHFEKNYSLAWSLKCFSDCYVKNLHKWSLQSLRPKISLKSMFFGPFLKKVWLENIFKKPFFSPFFNFLAQSVILADAKNHWTKFKCKFIFYKFVFPGPTFVIFLTKRIILM